MRSPRLFKNPNGGLLSLDVTQLQLGLSRCQHVAEDALEQLKLGVEVDVEALCHEILDEARKAAFAIEDEASQDEVAAIAANQ